MTRPRPALLGVLLVTLVMLSGGVGAISWQADLHTSDRAVATAIPTEMDDLPAESRAYGRVLATSGHVSITEYKIGIGSASTVFRHTAGDGWEAGETVCTPHFTYPNHFVVDGESYTIRGSSTKSTIHRQPAYGLVRLLVGVVGIGMLLVWVGSE